MRDSFKLCFSLSSKSLSAKAISTNSAAQALFNKDRSGSSFSSSFFEKLLIRSLIFLLVYFFLVSEHISIITLIPTIVVIFMVFTVFFLSRRENITELKKSLENIANIEKLK